jgi:hypothetical protein
VPKVELVPITSWSAREKSPASAHDTAAAPAPRGIGGWLILPAIGLVCGPVYRAFGIVLLQLVGQSLSKEGELQAAFTVVTILSSGMLVFQVFVAITFFRCLRFVPGLMIALYVALVLENFIGFFVLYSATREYPDPKDLLASVLAAAIWIPYFLLSRRVKATFVNGPERVVREVSEPVPPGPDWGLWKCLKMLLWNPTEHSEEENLRFSYLRAIEWANWPVWLSRVAVPVLLIWQPWYAVVGALFIGNLIWVLVVRYNVVSVTAAYVGVFFMMTRWVTWPASTIVLFVQGRSPECWVALAWPLLLWTPGLILPAHIGLIQALFMQALGYERPKFEFLTGGAPERRPIWSSRDGLDSDTARTLILGWEVLFFVGLFLSCLKLFGIIGWSWWVFLPIWVPIVLPVVIVVERLQPFRLASREKHVDQSAPGKEPTLWDQIYRLRWPIAIVIISLALVVVVAIRLGTRPGWQENVSPKPTMKRL